MTMVWKTPFGALAQTQVGLADVVSTWSAAYAVYGWLGGLEGTRSLLSKFPNSFSKRVADLGSLRLSPVTAHVLTSGGTFISSIPNTADAFGGDKATQVIGLTLCALAHELDSGDALGIFMQCVAPYLFAKDKMEVVDALRNQLNDASRLQCILNEGAARGFTDEFINSVNGLNINFGDKRWLREFLRQNKDMEQQTSELLMVGGLLKWIFQDSKATYNTRSGLVARVAAYLRVVGYRIGRIEAWDGIDSPPGFLGSNDVLLVTGGCLTTDTLMLNPEECNEYGRTRHYQYKTVGSMLLDALDNVSALSPEVFQCHFESIFTYAKAHLNVLYELNTKQKVVAKLQWKPYAKGSTPMERRIAAIYFPLSAECIAPCYSSIASEIALAQISKSKSAIFSFDDVPETLPRFRAISAAIALSITACLAKSTFESVAHSTRLELNSEMWLEPMCKILDVGSSSTTLGLHEVVSLLAAIHCAHDPESIKHCDSYIIAWRCGSYSVVPSILLTMAPTQEAIGFQCLDQYWGNVSAQKDGSINSAKTGGYVTDTDLMKALGTQSPDLSTLHQLDHPWIGPPVSGPPDTQLYLSFERPLHYSAPDLCFVGRVGGSVIGSAGIHDVLSVLLRSLSEAANCHGHSSAIKVVNVKASRWVANRHAKPVGYQQYTFIPVSRDPRWTLFLAGETIYSNGRIVLQCVECTAELAGTQGVLIGYL